LHLDIETGKRGLGRVVRGLSLFGACANLACRNICNANGGGCIGSRNSWAEAILPTPMNPSVNNTTTKTYRLIILRI
jgi:hypothetical protein